MSSILVPKHGIVIPNIVGIKLKFQEIGIAKHPFNFFINQKSSSKIAHYPITQNHVISFPSQFSRQPKIDNTQLQIQNSR